MTLSAVALVGGFLYLNSETAPPSISQAETEINALLEKNNDKGAEKRITKYVQDLSLSTRFKTDVGQASINPKFEKYLADKIFNVCGRSISSESKQLIIQNLVTDAAGLMKDASARLGNDIKSGALASLGVRTTDVVEKMEPLGDESHYEGKVPLLITLTDGKKIVYKPRSMLPEKVLCDKETGLLHEVGFGTYNVVCRSDDKGEFGYSELIENKQEENTVKSPKEVVEYLEKLCVLDKIGQELGLSDLHYLNIITQNKQPCIIDAEVFLVPPGIKTGIMDSQNGSAVMFDLSTGTMKSLLGKNKIWFDSSMGTKGAFKYYMFDEDLAKIGVDRQKIHDGVELAPPIIETVKSTKLELQKESGRFILIETKGLKDEMMSIDPLKPKSAEQLVGLIESEVEKYEGFAFDKGATEAITDQILKDATHNDIPAFCFNSTTNEIVYNGIVIGSKV